MDSSFLLTTVLVVVAAIGLFTLLRKVRFHQDTKENDSSSSSSSPSSSLSPSSVLPPSSSSRIWTHHVFPSFRGEDVRRDFLSHIKMEFERKGITPFIDNEIKRGESIGPELIRAIRESKILVVLLSRNYASSKWCLNELVEIVKCREKFGQTVLAIFYKVDPSDVEKLTGDFGKAFRKTCVGKTREDIGRWRQALSVVATIAGYNSNDWDNEAAMIKKIATDISNKLNNSIRSSDFDGLVGMRTHLVKMKPLLRLESNEVRMIGILGPPGIGKTTIARVAYNQLSHSFQLSTFVDNIKAGYTSPCSDDYNIKLQFHKQFISQITNHKDMEVSHLGVVQDRLKDKKTLVVFDGVDKSIQLDAMAKEISWFGPGSRIIITSQDHKLLKAHGVEHIYKVNLPDCYEACKIFCMYAFGQEYPKDGFEWLVEEVTRLAGKLPLGMRILGSYFKGMSKQDWELAMPRLKTSLDANIQSILKFSYDALDDEDKDLFLHIACIFNGSKIKRVEDYLSTKSLEVRQRLNVLVEKSLISLNNGTINMEMLLEKLGKEIVRKQSIHEPGRRQFLTDEVLSGEAEASKNVIGISLHNNGEGFDISETTFEVMSNLQFLLICPSSSTKLPRGLNYLPHKLRVLRWIHLPVTCLPSTVSFVFLVELDLRHSELEKLWEGIKPLPNLKYMDLSCSRNLRKLPDLSTATNLLDLCLSDCINLIELPSSIGCAKSLQTLRLSNCSELTELPSCIENATNLKELYLDGCKKLLELPSFIWNAINLRILNLSQLPILLELPSSVGNLTSLERLYLAYNSYLGELPSSIGNLTSLKNLHLDYCSNLRELPSSIGNLTSLTGLHLNGCSNLRELPSSIGNLTSLERLYLAYSSNPRELLSSIGNLTSLKELHLEYCSNMRELPSSIGDLANLERLHLSYCSNLRELPFSIGNLTSLKRLHLNCCSNLSELPSIIGNLTNLEILHLDYCSNLRELPFSIGNLTSLNGLHLNYCSNLRELPSSIGNLTSLVGLHLNCCSNLRELPSSIGNLTSLYGLYLAYCSNLRELPSSIGHLHELETLKIDGCYNLSFLPTTINMETLSEFRHNCFMMSKHTPRLEFPRFGKHQSKKHKYLSIPIWLQILCIEKTGIEREYIWYRTGYTNTQTFLEKFVYFCARN